MIKIIRERETKNTKLASDGDSIQFQDGVRQYTIPRWGETVYNSKIVYFFFLESIRMKPKKRNTVCWNSDLATQNWPVMGTVYNSKMCSIQFQDGVRQYKISRLYKSKKRKTVCWNSHLLSNYSLCVC